jgi:putative endonuclease
MIRGGTVYIMTNKSNSVLYTGVTSDLPTRVQQHISAYRPTSFTSKYNVNKLVYFCNYSTIHEAIAEEKRIKGGSRKSKIKLIETLNPSWDDLWIRDVSKW